MYMYLRYVLPSSHQSQVRNGEHKPVVAHREGPRPLISPSRPGLCCRLTSTNQVSAQATRFRPPQPSNSLTPPAKLILSSSNPVQISVIS